MELLEKIAKKADNNCYITCGKKQIAPAKLRYIISNSKCPEQHIFGFNREEQRKVIIALKENNFICQESKRAIILIKEFPKEAIS